MSYQCETSILLAFLLLTFSPLALAGDTSELSSTEQQNLAKTLGDKVQQFEMWTDDKGNVTGLIFINHQALTKSVGDKPGINDDDLFTLTQFPKLTALNIEAQPVGDRGLQVLKQFPGMTQVGFHYMGKAKGATTTPEFISVIDGMRDLEILEIKHNFKMNGIDVGELRGPFPKVWRLVVDTPLTAEQTLHLLSLCPNTTDLQLHRTNLNGEQLAAAAKLVPKLEVLWLKPRGELTPQHLSAVSLWNGLRIFSPQADSMVAWDGGWNHLADLKALERLEMSKGLRAKNMSAIEQLLRTCPKLVVDDKLTRSRNYAGL